MFRADLILDTESGGLYVGGRGRGTALSRATRYQTLCEAAVAACETGRLALIPESARTIGVVDAREGRVRLLGRVPELDSLWGSRIDRRQLESVADERERDERSRFRNAVITGNVAEQAKLGPKRGWRW